MSSGKRIGYIRVSTNDQNPDRQLEGIELDKRFIDFASAKTIDRPQLKAMLEFVREDDTILVHSMDRLARNITDLRAIVSRLVARKVEINFVKENLIFNGNESSVSKLLLSILGSVAEFEHAFILERQAEGIRIAKLKGKYKGTQKKLNADKIEVLKEEMKTRKTKTQIAFNLGISRACLYRYLKEHNLMGIDKEDMEKD